MSVATTGTPLMPSDWTAGITVGRPSPSDQSVV